jgi:phage terminase small subunit
MAKPTLPKPPPHLGKPGAAFWRDVVTEYSIADSAGLALTTRAAEALDRLREAQAAIARDGAIVLDRYSKPRVHPAAALEKDSANAFLQAVKALRLDIDLPKAPGRPPGSWSPAR